MKLPTTILLAGALLLGQSNSAPILVAPNYTALKTYLNLSDSQLQSLENVQNSRNQAVQAIYSQISQKYMALNSLLSSGSGTAAQLGQFLLDIQALQKQVPTTDTPYKMQARNVLTADQMAKLPTLSQALQLQTTAWQAIGLLLIDSPTPSGAPLPAAMVRNSIPYPLGLELSGPGAADSAAAVTAQMAVPVP
jgi:hypothetical protein